MATSPTLSALAVVVLLVLASSVDGYWLLEQSYESKDCSGTAQEMVVVSPSNASDCPLPRPLCEPNPNTDGSILVSCLADGSPYSFPPGYAVEYVYSSSSSCTGNATLQTAILAGSCVSPGNDQSILFDCANRQVTSCPEDSPGCAGADCSTAPLPTGCVATGQASIIIKCT